MVKIHDQFIIPKHTPAPVFIATPTSADATPSLSGETTVVLEEKQDSNGVNSPSVEANQLANFAPNEITITDEATPASPDIAELIGANNFEDDLQRADRPPGDTLYVSWNEKLTECLSLAYVICTSSLTPISLRGSSRRLTSRSLVSVRCPRTRWLWLRCSM